jgi:serine/threonine protein kinase
LFAVLSIFKANASQEATRDLFNELEIMASVDEHPNIVNLIGACTAKGKRR